MSLWIYILAAMLILVFWYLLVRLGTSAYFRSKRENLKKAWEDIKNE